MLERRGAGDAGGAGGGSRQDAPPVSQRPPDRFQLFISRHEAIRLRCHSTMRVRARPDIGQDGIVN